MDKPPGLPVPLPARPVATRRPTVTGAAMAAAALVPMLVLALLLAAWSTGSQKGAAERRLGDAADTLVLTVERDLAEVAATLETAVALTGFPDDPQRFRATALQLRDSRPGWRSVFLATAYGQLAMDTAMDTDGTEPSPDPATLREAIVGGRAAVSGRLGEDPPRVAVALPLLRNGLAEAVVGAVLRADRWGDTPLPEGWRGILLDREGRSLAGPVPDWLAGKEITEEPLRGPDDRGGTLVAALRRSPLTGWSVGVAAPEALLHAPARRSLRTMIAVTLGTLALACGAVFLVTRRMRAKEMQR